MSSSITDKNSNLLWSKSFIIIALVNALAFLGFNMATAGFPVYLSSLDIDESVVGFSTSLAAVGSLLMRPFAGYLCAKISCKSFSFMGLALMAVPCAISMVAINTKVLLLMRFLQGIGWGISSTCCATIIAQCVPSTRLSEGVGYAGAISSVTTAFASSLAIFILQSMNGISMIISIGLVIALAILLLLLMRPTEIATSNQVRKNPIVICPPNAIVPAVMIFFITFGYSPIITFVTRFASESGFAGVSLFFLVYAIATIVIRPITGIFTDKYGCVLPTVFAMTTSVLSLVFLLVARNSMIFYFAGALSGISTGMGMNALQTMALKGATTQTRAATMSTYLFGFDFGMAIGASISGLLVKTYTYNAMYGIAAIAPCVGLLFFILICAVKRKRVR